MSEGAGDILEVDVRQRRDQAIYFMSKAREKGFLAEATDQWTDTAYLLAYTRSDHELSIVLNWSSRGGSGRGPDCVPLFGPAVLSPSYCIPDQHSHRHLTFLPLITQTHRLAGISII